MNQLIIALVISVTSFGAGWKTQGWRRDSQEIERVQQNLLKIQANAAADLRRTDNVITAQNAAATRATLDRLDANRARSESNGLRVDIDRLNARLRANPKACPDAAATIGDVFEQCTEAYRGLAEDSDRHVNDLRTLNEAWPK